MNLKEYRYKVNWLKKANRHLDIVEQNEQMLELCRSVYDECKETMKDWELEVMLHEYQQCLLATGVSCEIDEILNLREEVFRHLAERSFLKYGKKWGNSLYSRGFNNSRRRASLKDFNAAIAIYERLQSMGVNAKMELAACCRHAAMVSDLRGLHTKTIRYHNKQLAIQLALENPNTDVFFEIGCAYKTEGEAYLKLGRYEESVEYFSKAREVFVNIGKRVDDWFDCFFLSGVHMDAIDSFLDDIKREHGVCSENNPK